MLDNIPLLFPLCTLYGLACGLFLPRIVQEVVAYKCLQYDRTVPAVLADTRSKAPTVVLHVLLCAGTGLTVEFNYQNYLSTLKNSLETIMLGKGVFIRMSPF